MEEEQQQLPRTRIYVRGLGEKVTDDDLANVFSSLGQVEAVEIVRTKGRSFAYVDFFPSSDKSLPKLFSTFNGCVWKGGRLRLEKAKEHYLARLAREWAEDSEVASCPVIVTDSVDEAANKDVEKLKKVLDKEKKLNIFFPRFRKLKVLPFTGTGKHKYSFQRVEAPPVPVHFCDCEEHSAAFHSVEGKPIRHYTAGEGRIHDMEAPGGVINEEEVGIMNSVMNKLFTRDNVSKAGLNETVLADDEHNSDKLIEDLQIGGNEVDSVADEDDLIINAVSRRNSRMASSRCQGKTIILPKNKKITPSETRDFKDSSAQDLPKEQKMNNLLLNNKRKSVYNDEMRSPSSIDVGNLQINANKSRTPLAAQNAETVSDVRKSTSHSWSQKMPWKALVGNQDNRVFSVSNLLPSDASTKEADSAIEFEDLEFDENQSDEDNLILNVVSKKKPKMAFSSRQEHGTTSSMNQKSMSQENITIKGKPIQKRNGAPPPKKKKSIIVAESDHNKSVDPVTDSSGSPKTHTETEMPSEVHSFEPESGSIKPISDHLVSINSSVTVLVGNKGNDQTSISNKLPDDSAKELPVSEDVLPGFPDSKNWISTRNENVEGKSTETESLDGVAETQPAQSNASPNKSGKGSSWFQRTPWTQMINESNNSFSITQISSGITFTKHEVSKTQVENALANLNDNKGKPESEATGELLSRGSIAREDSREGHAVSQRIPDKDQPTLVGSNEASASVTKKYETTPRLPTDVDTTVGETCSFMRSAASIKEWSTAKAALSGSQSLKRKSREK